MFGFCFLFVRKCVPLKLKKFFIAAQDNYTFAQPGIQKKVRALADLISRVDGLLIYHLAMQFTG
jgi:hypothetical protein